MSTNFLCCYVCGYEINDSVFWWDGGKPRHRRCQPPTQYAPNPPGTEPGATPLKQLTEDDVRRIVREELDKRFDSTGELR